MSCRVNAIEEEEEKCDDKKLVFATRVLIQLAEKYVCSSREKKLFFSLIKFIAAKHFIAICLMYEITSFARN
jgi:hypothetical protein